MVRVRTAALSYDDLREKADEFPSPTPPDGDGPDPPYIATSGETARGALFGAAASR